MTNLATLFYQQHWKIFSSSVVLLNLLAFSLNAQASTFASAHLQVSSTTHSSTELQNFATELESAHSYVTRRLQPQLSSNCPIQVRLRPLSKTAETNPDLSNCQNAVIEIDPSKHQNAYQIGVSFAHELVHLFRVQINSSFNDFWLEEGLAELIERDYARARMQESTGQTLDLRGLLTQDFKPENLQTIQLIQTFDDFISNESNSALAHIFVRYLRDHFGGDEFLREILTSSLTGWQAIEYAAKNLHQKGAIKFHARYLQKKSIWAHFVFAVLLNTTQLAQDDLFWIGSYFQPLLQSSAAATTLSNLPVWSARFIKRSGSPFLSAEQMQTFIDNGHLFFTISTNENGMYRLNEIKQPNDPMLTLAQFIVLISFDR